MAHQSRTKQLNEKTALSNRYRLEAISKGVRSTLSNVLRNSLKRLSLSLVSMLWPSLSFSCVASFMPITLDSKAQVGLLITA